MRVFKLRINGCGKLVGEDVELYAAVAAGFVCDGVNIQIRGSEVVVYATYHGIIVRFRRGIRFVPLFWEQGGGFEQIFAESSWLTQARKSANAASSGS